VCFLVVEATIQLNTMRDRGYSGTKKNIDIDCEEIVVARDRCSLSRNSTGSSGRA